MKVCKYERLHHTIKDLKTGKRKPYESVSQAKKESFRLQMAEDGALGRGSVRLT